MVVQGAVEVGRRSAGASLALLPAVLAMDHARTPDVLSPRDALDALARAAATLAPDFGFLPRGSAPVIMIFGGLFVLATTVTLALLLQPRGPIRPSRDARPGGGTTLLGAMVGALCGLFTYVAGFVAIVLSAPPRALEELGLQGALSYVMDNVTYWEILFMVAGAAFGSAVARYRWRGLGLLSYIGLCVLVLGYLLYAFTGALPKVPEGQRPLSALLLLAEAGSLGLVLVFAFYSLDVASRRRWARLPERLPFSPSHQPRVAIQVPVFNEPLEVVRTTVAKLCAQDYPRDKFLVMVCDDSTDPELRATLQAHCERLGAWYVHRGVRTGFKAGALNHALKLCPPDVEVIGVVDADYWVEPGYLRSLVGFFVNPRLGFLQTPQDYRNDDESFLTRAYHNAEAYFYYAVLPSRNEENAIIFCGTMGLLRRRALEQAGGWGEDQICEDAEISVRLSTLGWDSLYVDRSFGKGLMPSTFDAYKKQFHRWAFGNVRILTTHLGRILRSRMSTRQKFDFVAGNLHWFDGIFVMTIALGLMYVAVGELTGKNMLTHHQRELALLALVPAFLLFDGFTRIHLALQRAAARRSRRLTLPDTMRVLGMWFAIKFTNMSAALKSIAGIKAPFVRTPKAPGGPLSPARALGRALRLSPGETAMACMLLTVSLLMLARAARLATPVKQQSAAVLGLWLGFYALIFACAPIYAYMSFRTLKPAPPPMPLFLPAPPPAATGSEAVVVATLAPAAERSEAFEVVRSRPKDDRVERPK